MKKIGKHKNIISLIGACTQNGKHLFPSCQVAQLVVAKMHFNQKVHYPESPFQIILDVNLFLYQTLNGIERKENGE